MEPATGWRRRSWAAWGLIAYLLAVILVLVLPVGYSAIVLAIADWLRAVAGISSFGAGWIEFGANILMFAPLGFLLTLLFRRPLYGVLLALALSVGAEIAQIVIPSRVPTFRDILANALGAAIGAALAWLMVLRRERRAGRDAEGRAQHPRSEA